MVSVWRHSERRSAQQLFLHQNSSASNAPAAAAVTATGCSNYPVAAAASGPADESLEQHENDHVATDTGIAGVAEVNVKYAR